MVLSRNYIYASDGESSSEVSAKQFLLAIFQYIASLEAWDFIECCSLHSAALFMTDSLFARNFMHMVCVLGMKRAERCNRNVASALESHAY